MEKNNLLEKFDGNGIINAKEYNELKKLADGKEDTLKSLDKKQLEDLKLVLEAQKDQYLQRNLPEDSKKWISILTEKAIKNIDKILAQKENNSSSSVVEKSTESQNITKDLVVLEKKYHIKITKTDANMYVVTGAKDKSLNGAYTDLAEIKKAFEKVKTSKSQKPEKHVNVYNSSKGNNVEQTTTNKKTETQVSVETKEKGLTAQEAEKEFDKRLESMLNPNTTLIFNLGDKVFLMQFDTANQKKVAERFFTSLEKTFNDDRMAAYAVLMFLKKNADYIVTPEEIYKKAGEGLYGNQIVITEDKKTRNLALLDAARKKDIKAIEVDTGSKLANAFLNTLTVNIFDIDTANVTKETLEDGEYGRKATSTDLWKGYYKIIHKNKDGKDIEYSNDKYTYDFNAEVIPLQEPLKHFTVDKIAKKVADEVEKYIKDGEVSREDLAKQAQKNIFAKIALDYYDYLLNQKRLKTPEKLFHDKAIKKWLQETNELDKYTSKSDVIEITQDGFFHINNPEELNKPFVKVKLDKVDGKEDKEVLMKVSKATYEQLFGKNAEIFADKLANIGPIVLKDGTICNFTKEGIYVLGENIKDGVDGVKDFIKEHQTVTAAILGGIVGALLVKGIHINLADFAKGLQNLGKTLGKPFEHFGKVLEEKGKDVIDAIRHWDISKLEAFGLGYLTTALALNYKSEIIKERLAQVSAKYEGSDAIKEEILALVGEDKKFNTEINFNSEAQNAFAHYYLVKAGLFNPGEATGISFDVVKKGEDKFEVIATGTGNNEKSRIVVDGKELYIPEGKEFVVEMTINENNQPEIKKAYGEVKVDVTGKDDYIKFTGDKVEFYVAHTFGKDDKKFDIPVSGLSFDELVKKAYEEKKGDKNISNPTTSQTNIPR